MKSVVWCKIRIWVEEGDGMGGERVKDQRGKGEGGEKGRGGKGGNGMEKGE